jgi:predicted flap endonuclease-1-like 5' DNA nuclease
MRLDYALYGLAIVLFATTAITFAMVAEQNGRTIYAASTTAVGLLFVVGGYVMRPKVKGAVAVQSSTTETPAMPTMEVPQMAPPVVDASKTEPSMAEPSTTDAIPVMEVPRVDTSIVEAPVTTLVSPEPQTTEVVPIEAENFPVEVVVPLTQIGMSPKTASTPGKPELSQIRGISEKRAEQLKANGISTIGELANASAEDLAVKLSLSPKIVKMWIGSAKKLSK